MPPTVTNWSCAVWYNADAAMIVDILRVAADVSRSMNVFFLSGLFFLGHLALSSSWQRGTILIKVEIDS